MDVSLTPEIEEIIRRKVEAGDYPSASALIEDALFLLVERDWRESREDLTRRLGGDPFPTLGPGDDRGGSSPPLNDPGSRS